MPVARATIPPVKRHLALALGLVVACNAARPATPSTSSAEVGGARATSASSGGGGRDAGAGEGGHGAGSGGAAADAGGLALPSPLCGVTADDISNLPDLVAALAALPRKPTTRIVFDETQAPAYYAEAVPQIGAISYVMGEILDSAYVAQSSVAAYAKRTSDYLAAFPTGVDLWEVGNEINGNWLGTTSEVVQKMTTAFDLVKAAGGRTELTLYGCSDSGAEYDMFTWAAANIPARMFTGLDYVLVSYYEGDCGAPRAASTWPGVFAQLHQMFPNAGVGFGETGAVDTNGDDIADPTVAGPYLERYYGMNVAVPRYVGGYFWWYFAEDMVPKTKPLFATLATAIQ
jgi:hypothetical protein